MKGGAEYNQLIARYQALIPVYEDAAHKMVQTAERQFKQVESLLVHCHENIKTAEDAANRCRVTAERIRQVLSALMRPPLTATDMLSQVLPCAEDGKSETLLVGPLLDMAMDECAKIIRDRRPFVVPDNVGELVVRIQDMKWIAYSKRGCGVFVRPTGKTERPTCYFFSEVPLPLFGIAWCAELTEEHGFVRNCNKKVCIRPDLLAVVADRKLWAWAAGGH